jgi:hypothetical protein
MMFDAYRAMSSGIGATMVNPPGYGVCERRALAMQQLVPEFRARAAVHRVPMRGCPSWAKCTRIWCVRPVSGRTRRSVLPSLCRERSSASPPAPRPPYTRASFARVGAADGCVDGTAPCRTPATSARYSFCIAPVNRDAAYLLSAHTTTPEVPCPSAAMALNAAARPCCSK